MFTLSRSRPSAIVATVSPSSAVDENLPALDVDAAVHRRELILLWRSEMTANDEGPRLSDKVRAKRASDPPIAALLAGYPSIRSLA